MNEEIQTTIQTKVCTKCKTEQHLSNFVKNKRTKDGYASWCKQCFKVYQSNRDKCNYKRRITKDKESMLKHVPHSMRYEMNATRDTKNKNERQRTIANKFYKNCFLSAYERLLGLGLSQHTIKTIFGCSRTGLDNNTVYDAEGQEAYRNAMAEVQAKLASHLLINAIGYDYQEESVVYKSVIDEKTLRRKWVPDKKTVYTKHQAGDGSLLTLFMINKFPREWKVSKEIITGKSEGYDSEPSQRVRKVIESLGRDVLKGNTDRAEAKHPVQDGLAQLPVGSDKNGEE